MGNLFSRQVQPSEIKQMPYHELVYWNKWHKSMSKAEKDATPIPEI